MQGLGYFDVQENLKYNYSLLGKDIIPVQSLLSTEQLHLQDHLKALCMPILYGCESGPVFARSSARSP